jgi:hypothetical protein
LLAQEPGPRGSPHEPQAEEAVSISDRAFPDDDETAKTDSSFETFRLSQEGQAGTAAPKTICSNLRPQPPQAYSKSGMGTENSATSTEGAGVERRASAGSPYRAVCVKTSVTRH